MVSFDGVSIFEQHPPTASAVVWKGDDEYIWAAKYNEKYNKWDRISKGESGIDDAEVINKALEYIDDGLPHFKTLKISGYYEINDTIKVPSYVILDLYDSYIKLADNTQKPMIINSNIFTIHDPTSIDYENKYIEIHGGVLDGNKDEQQNIIQNGNPAFRNPIILFNRSYRIVVKDAIIKNGQNDGIVLLNFYEQNGSKQPSYQLQTSDSVIHNCRIDNCGTYVTYEKGIHFNSISNTIISNCMISNISAQAVHTFASKHILIENSKATLCKDGGFWVSYGTSFSVISNCVVEGCDNTSIGISPARCADSYPISQYVNRFNNIAIGNVIDGGNTGITARYSNCHIIGNVIYNPGSKGIYIWGDDKDVSNILISNNLIIGSGDSTIEVSTESNNFHNIKIENNEIIDSGNRGIKITVINDTNYYIENLEIKNNLIIRPSANGIDVVYNVKNCCIIGNTVVNPGSICIGSYLESGYYQHLIVKDNWVDPNISISNRISISSLADAIITSNYNYTTENHGTATINADGSTTSFTIPHRLVSTPNYVNVIPKGSSPKPDSIDDDSTNITLTFSTAPASGTYYYWWEARV